jgi:ribonuclease R
MKRRSHAKRPPERRHGAGRREGRGARAAQGSIAVSRTGNGAIRPASGGDEVLVRADEMGDAVHGDLVEYRLIRHPQRGGAPAQARVVRVVAREPRRLAGIMHRHGDRLILEPVARRFPRGPLSGSHPELTSGSRVVVLLPGGRHPGPPRYRLLERLGDLSDPLDDGRDIALELGLPLAFSAPALDEASLRAGGPVTAEQRVDLRHLDAITIDPEEAADFDDAVSWRPLPGGYDEVGIHIADVACYAEPGGAVDGAALERGTSVYLPGLVLPMLPAALSSDAASLKPRVDRPAVSLRARLDGEGRVRDWRLDRSLIQSRRRLTYVEATDLLSGEASDTSEEPDPAASEGEGGWRRGLKRLAEISERLRARREERGGLYLDVPEYRVQLDELGLPLDFTPRHQGAAHRLVEEFMLLANELTGGWARSANLPLLFRIHERPRWEKLLDFGLVLDELGLTRIGTDLANPVALRRVVEAAEARGLGELVSGYLLRSLEKARYAAEDCGHFGLGAEGYTHFTSPIRRYPDLHNHRVLLAATAALGDGGSGGRRRPDADRLLAVVRDRYGADLEGLADTTSAREIMAQTAERLVMRVKALRLLVPRLGDEMEGMVTGTLVAGLFVVLDEVPVDGFVARERLPADRYDLGPRGHSLAGRRKGTRFAIGQRVRVRIERLSVLHRELDLSIVGGALGTSSAGRTR